ncbi:hypothetical protein HA075_04775 [bacterium BFN5]|nr:hypothetical protein HA075_04705 [bacterium BFN5]QJW45223.1 hypothetical protein HA075_04775 [bacterium BFN5]
MIIWQGYGILIPIVILTICLMTQYSLTSYFMKAITNYKNGLFRLIFSFLQQSSGLSAND